MYGSQCTDFPGPIMLLRRFYIGGPLLDKLLGHIHHLPFHMAFKTPVSVIGPSLLHTSFNDEDLEWRDTKINDQIKTGISDPCL